MRVAMSVHWSEAEVALKRRHFRFEAPLRHTDRCRRCSYGKTRSDRRIVKPALLTHNRIVSIGPLIAAHGQVLPFGPSGKAVALDPSELVGLRRRGERGWQDGQPGSGPVRFRKPHRGLIAAVAGVMVLSEVAKRAS